MTSNTSGTLPRRPYGTNGDQLSIVGFGGIVVMNAPQDHANRAVARAVEAGVNYFDVAPTYGDAELRLGPALQPYRKNCFLACKTTKRDAQGAQAELTQSLKNLRTDHVDLYQLHGLIDVAKDVDAAFAKGGAMEVFIQAKKSGQARHLGFSAHSLAAALTAIDRFDFDSILFPVNFAMFFKGNFGPTVLAAAAKKGISVLALKSMAEQRWPAAPVPGATPAAADAALAAERQKFDKCWYQPLSDPRQAELALRFTLTQPITAALPPGEEALYWPAVEMAQRFKPITPGETEELRAMAGELEPLFHA